MKFNKIKDVKKKKKEKSVRLKDKKKLKNKIFGIKKESNIKTIVCLPSNKDEVSANWKQISNLIKNNSSQDNLVLEKVKKFSDKNKEETISKDKLRFKLKRKLKREKSKLNKNKKIKNCVNKKENDKESNKNKIWFEIDNLYLDRAVNPGKPAQKAKEEDLIKKGTPEGITKAVSIDCEMVGVGANDKSAIARISIVNQFGHCLYDKFVKPEEKVVNYRTFVSGIRPNNFKNAIDFKIAKKEVEEIIRNKILVGHAINNDLSVLGINHPKQLIRDTSSYFKKIFNGKLPSLKRLSETLLNVKVQTGEHSSVEDARATMRLYTMYRKDWENSIKKNNYFY